LRQRRDLTFRALRAAGERSVSAPGPRAARRGRHERQTDTECLYHPAAAASPRLDLGFRPLMTKKVVIPFELGHHRNKGPE